MAFEKRACYRLHTDEAPTDKIVVLDMADNTPIIAEQREGSWHGPFRSPELHEASDGLLEKLGKLSTSQHSTLMKLLQ